jgi:beta-1,4-mannosyltransferase
MNLETNPGARINTNRHIKVRKIRQAWSVPEGFPKMFYLLWAPFKAVFMTVQLFWIMGCITQRPDFIIVQVSGGGGGETITLLDTNTQ